MGRTQRGGARRSSTRRGPTRRAVQLAGLALLVAPLTTGCSVEEVLRFGWPVGVTPQAEEMRLLWTWSAIAALVVRRDGLECEGFGEFDHDVHCGTGRS